MRTYSLNEANYSTIIGRFQSVGELSVLSSFFINVYNVPCCYVVQPTFTFFILLISMKNYLHQLIYLFYYFHFLQLVFPLTNKYSHSSAIRTPDIRQFSVTYSQ